MRGATIVLTTSVIVVVLVIGFIRLRLAYSKLVDKQKFAHEYLSKFRAFISKRDFDAEAYYWLTHSINKIQMQLGRLGIMDYRPPFENQVIHDYQVIINTLPEIRSGSAHPSMINSCEEALVRYMGRTDDLLEEAGKELRNPFAWMREGVQTILLLPILLISAMGIIRHYQD